MSCLLAKIKRKRAEPYRKITSDKAVFNAIDFSTISAIPYSADYKLDEDEWFKVENFDKEPYCLDIFKNSFDSKDHNDITKSEFDEISYLVSVQNDSFYVQNITPSNFLRLKTIFYGELDLGEVSKIVENSKQIVLKKEPDAVYEVGSNTLFFKELSSIAKIFDGIGLLYKDATQAEVDNFLQQGFIKKSNDYNKVSDLNRRLIKVASDTLSKLSQQEQQQIFQYVDSYCANDIKFDAQTKQFEINSDKDLKTLLYGIHQRFYTTHLGQEKRLANSIKKL